MERNVSLDILKLLMAFMVIGLHARFLSEFTSLGSYIFVNGLFRIAVPVFFVINGFYFASVLNKGTQKSWFSRLIILYAVWMVFYAYFWLPRTGLSYESVVKALETILLGYYHLWYIAGLLGAAIILHFTHRCDSKTLVLSILVAFIMGLFIQYAGNYNLAENKLVDKVLSYERLHRNALLFSYPFFCIGYLINRQKIHTRFSLQTAAIMAIVGTSLLILESYINFIQLNGGSEFDIYFSLMIACPFIFILFTKISMNGDGKKISLYSSAVYFIHIFWLKLLSGQTSFDPTIMTIACIFLSVISALVIIEVNKKLKFIL